MIIYENLHKDKHIFRTKKRDGLKNPSAIKQINDIMFIYRQFMQK